MPLAYDPSYFFSVLPNIYDNTELREPQINAYRAVYDHFVTDGRTNHAIIVLPTGVGKTGLMGILPYFISKGRVLVITPQLVIKDAVLDSLDPDYPGNFWTARKVFESTSSLPCLIEYEGSDTKKEWLDAANIVVLNVHKLQQRLDSSLLNRVGRDFFDMIIIDEAHHSTARTWVEAIQYFSNAKVVKLTGTPFRTDKEKITGDLVYKYKLSMAMAHGYVKSLVNRTYIPGELLLTIDDDDSQTYTVEQIYDMGIKDEDWVSRSVAYSTECSAKVVDESIEALEAKLSDSNTVPHKIIAVACSIRHARQIESLYKERGYECAIIHSKLDPEQKEANLKAIENHRVKVVINVAMLGEGYDHPYLSIAAIFRPFRHPLPYAQFIGRILRSIPLSEATRNTDNIGEIVSHKHLYLDILWNYYKEEIQESETIEYLNTQPEIEDVEDEDDLSGTREYDLSIGTAREIGQGKLASEAYLETELIKQRNLEMEDVRKKITELQNLLSIPESEAKRIYYSTQGRENAIKRPDLYFKKISKDVDVRIKEDIVPELITRYGLDKKGNTLKNCRLFTHQKYRWIANKFDNNAAFLAVYFNAALVDKIGYKKEFWKPSDYEVASTRLDELYEFVIGVLDDYTTKH